MTLGALCAALACFAGLQAVLGGNKTIRPSANELIRATTLSPVEWRLQQREHEGWYRRWIRPIALLWAGRLHLRPARIDPVYLIQAGLEPDQIDGVELRAIRLMSAAAGALLAGLAAILLSGAFLLVPLFAWAGYVAPARYLAGRRRRRQDSLQRELPQLISMLRAFTLAGMPLERALHILSANSRSDSLLRGEIQRALGRYGLGLSIEQALEEVGSRTGVDDVAMFVGAVAHSKRIGSDLDATLRDQELMVRMNQRNRSTAQAAAVGTKLLAVLGGIYLPEFVILIVVPLFWGIMQRAFG
ncbi:MAG: tight adherence protein [Chloroflexota bacterium]|jgi:Flp pilus assembly protein TadB|nr:tight adherence protein [Chloroflexota bacterium]